MMAERQTDLIVIGAGPAGAHAALAASAHGLDVHLVDEAPQAGGQVWRAPLDGAPVAATPETGQGDALRRQLEDSAVHFEHGHRVWSVLAQPSGGFQVDSLGPDGPSTLTAPRLIAATGAHERIIPFPGWTLPGVMGLAAATILLKSHGVVPGARPVIAGAGPLLLAVAAAMLDADIKPLAVIDLDARADWLARAPALATQPALLARGTGWAARVIASGVPILHRHAVRAAHGQNALDRITVSPVDATGAFVPGEDQQFDTDALLVGHGLTPGAEIPRLLDARMIHDRLLGGFVPKTDALRPHQRAEPLRDWRRGRHPWRATCRERRRGLRTRGGA
jgi:thioredoxin reductase